MKLKQRIDVLELYRVYLYKYGNHLDTLKALKRDGLGTFFFKNNLDNHFILLDEFCITTDVFLKAGWLRWGGDIIG